MIFELKKRSRSDLWSIPDKFFWACTMSDTHLFMYLFINLISSIFESACSWQRRRVSTVHSKWVDLLIFAVISRHEYERGKT